MRRQTSKFVNQDKTKLALNGRVWQTFQIWKVNFSPFSPESESHYVILKAPVKNLVRLRIIFLSCPFMTSVLTGLARLLLPCLHPSSVFCACRAPIYLSTFEPVQPVRMTGEIQRSFSEAERQHSGSVVKQKDVIHTAFQAPLKLI